jgi:alanyl-tRNA synthetase
MYLFLFKSIKTKLLIIRNPEHELRIGDECLISIDDKNRVGAMRHHTAVHLLNAALQKILPVIGQRGSNVQKDILQFECSTFGKKLSIDDIIAIEKLVNEAIRANVPVQTKIVNFLEMLNEKNLTIIPGETYPDAGIRIIEVNNGILNSKYYKLF